MNINGFSSGEIPIDPLLVRGLKRSGLWRRNPLYDVLVKRAKAAEAWHRDAGHRVVDEPDGWQCLSCAPRAEAPEETT